MSEWILILGGAAIAIVPHVIAQIMTYMKNKADHDQTYANIADDLNQDWSRMRGERNKALEELEAAKRALREWDRKCEECGKTIGGNNG